MHFKEMINHLSFLVVPTFFQHFFAFLAWYYSCWTKCSKTFFFMPEFYKSLSLWKPSSFTCYFNKMQTKLIYRDYIIFQINSNFCFLTTFFLPCRIRFIHFHFQLFRFVENVNFSVITLYNLLISINRIQLNG